MHVIHMSSMEDASHMATPTMGDYAPVSNELLVRRIKNRERQRRYRARKRLEAEMKNVYFLNHQTLRLEEHKPYTAGASHGERVQCSRDWKKDAREAQANVEADNSQYNTIVPVVPASEVESDHLVVCHMGRRDWKAAARDRLDSANLENSSGNSDPLALN